MFGIMFSEIETGGDGNAFFSTINRKYRPKSFFSWRIRFLMFIWSIKGAIVEELALRFKNSPLNDAEVERMIAEIVLEVIKEKSWNCLEIMDSNRFPEYAKRKLFEADFCRIWTDSDATIFFDAKEKLILFIKERMGK